MKVTIIPSVPHGKASVPASKSYGHRMVIAAALANGKSEIKNISFCEDIYATLDCVEALGASYTVDGNTVTVTGRGGIGSEEARLPCRDSGSTLRFMIPVALLGGGKYSFVGSHRLFERGVGVYEDRLAARGVIFEPNENGMDITGSLAPGEYTLPGNVSSQYITGLLFALPLLDGNSTIKVLPPIESRRYIDITIAVIRGFGVEIDEPETGIFRIAGNQKYIPTDCTVEGDWSNAAFFTAANHMGADIELCGLDPESLQGDRIFGSLADMLEQPGCEMDISDCPDLGPILFTLAAYKHGAHITGTRRLRIKESDRAAVMARELAKFGAQIDIYDNSVVVHDRELRTPTEMLYGHNDHRIVMSLAVLSAVLGGTIDGSEAVSKSFPDFFRIMEKLGVEVIYDA